MNGFELWGALFAAVVFGACIGAVGIGLCVMARGEWEGDGE